MLDRTTKIIMAAIALGLWANALIPVLKPQPAAASAESSLSNIERYTGGLYNGVCLNRKLCN